MNVHKISLSNCPNKITNKNDKGYMVHNLHFSHTIHALLSTLRLSTLHLPTPRLPTLRSLYTPLAIINNMRVGQFV